LPPRKKDARWQIVSTSVTPFERLRIKRARRFELPTYSLGSGFGNFVTLVFRKCCVRPRVAVTHSLRFCRHAVTAAVSVRRLGLLPAVWFQWDIAHRFSRGVRHGCRCRTLSKAGAA